MELSSDMKVLLLDMLFKEYDEALGLAVKKQVFETTWCQGARAVQSWETVMTNKFGQVATDSAAFHAMLKKIEKYRWYPESIRHDGQQAATAPR